MTVEPATYDYVIIGAGSAGCVVAERLSADPAIRVLLVEAGGPDSSYLIHMPKGIAKLVSSPSHIWAYNISQPRIEGGQPNEIWIRGKGLGGSSSINGMIWSRGEPQDYDDWAAQGCTGWNGESMNQAYKALEDHDLGESATRGAGGPVHIASGTYHYPLADRIVEAGKALGLQETPDLNSVVGKRVGYYSHNIKKGRRQSGAVAFLRKAQSRSNLEIVTNTVARNIEFSNGRASGVVLRTEGKGDYTVKINAEIILCAGTMESPQILQRSGIGDGDVLRSHGITVTAHSPDVGQNMLEHLSYTMPYRLKRNVGIAQNFMGLGLLKSVAQYYLFHTGPMATGPFEIGMFDSLADPTGRTNFQAYLGGFAFALGDNNDAVPLGNLDSRPAMTISGTLLRQTSKGSIQVLGPDARAGADIKPNWLATSEDQITAVASIRYMRRVLEQTPLADDVGEELIPGRHLQSDEELLDSFRKLSTSGLHGVGTCRMGGDEPSVVDARLRVRGVDGVRVADCSIMPGLITGNTNAPAMAVGWKAAELILQDRNAG